MSVFLCVCEELHLVSDSKVSERGFRISFPVKLEIWDLSLCGPGKEKGQALLLIDSAGKMRKT